MPMMAINSPGSTVRSTPRSACTSFVAHACRSSSRCVMLDDRLRRHGSALLLRSRAAAAAATLRGCDWSGLAARRGARASPSRSADVPDDHLHPFRQPAARRPRCCWPSLSPVCTRVTRQLAVGVEVQSVAAVALAVARRPRSRARRRACRAGVAAVAPRVAPRLTAPARGSAARIALRRLVAASVGLKRSAAFGTCSTFVRRAGQELHRRRHPRKQLAVRVLAPTPPRCSSPRCRSWSTAGAPASPVPLKRLVGIRLHGEAHRLAFLDLADVALVDRRQDLHLREVVGDEEELRRGRLAATVWPTSTLRSTTTPSIGA